jgi:hypothetical protein
VRSTAAKEAISRLRADSNMRSHIRATVVALVTLACAWVPAAGGAAPRHLPADYSAWTQVAICESGGWQVLGSAYPDPFGITAHNWAWAVGKPMPTGPVPMAARAAAIRVADRFIHKLGISIPDHGGCHGSW